MDIKCPPKIDFKISLTLKEWVSMGIIFFLEGIVVDTRCPPNMLENFSHS